MADTTTRVGIRLDAADQRMLRIMAAHVQRTTQSPFVSPVEALRKALWIAAEFVAKQAQGPGGMAQ